MTDGSQEPTLRFGDAIAELETILARIEGEEIDIDQLGEELKRATQLLELCRAKIKKAEVEVSQIVQSLERTEGE
jgi:exodeoxyribonuclease VII small subunit